MYKIYLIGVDQPELPRDKTKVLTRCGLIVGSKQHLQLVKDMNAESCLITPLSEAFTKIKQHLQKTDVGVLASGDPLFFGVGRKLIGEFGSKVIDIMPALSSMQLACCRFKVPWDDFAMVSLHGRDGMHAVQQLLIHEKVFVLTDLKKSPDILAKKIINYLELIGAQDVAARFKVYVAENLGSPEERIFEGSLETIAGTTFSQPNVMLLYQPEKQVTPGKFGLSENEIAHDRGLITKDEVRAVTLHKLRLPAHGVFWDIGAGSGSISLEAARLNPDLIVYAVERDKNRLATVKKNINHFQTFNVIPQAGEAPATLRDLPDPACAFIGGSCGYLPAIIDSVADRLPKGGRVVVNAVTDRTAATAPKLLGDKGLSVEASRINVERITYPVEAGTANMFNPITVITGIK